MFNKLLSLFKKPDILPVPSGRSIERFRTHFAEDVSMSVCHSNIMNFIDTVKTITEVSKEKHYLTAEIKNRITSRNVVNLLAYLTPDEGSIRLDKLLEELVAVVREMVVTTDFYNTSSNYYSRHAKACMLEYQEILEAFKRTGELYEKHQKSVEAARYSSRR